MTNVFKQKTVLLIISIILIYMPLKTNSQKNQSILILDSDTSIVLPHFDTSSVANSNIESITLSLYVLDKIPDRADRLQITINPIDLNTNVVSDGLSTFVNVNKDSYADFRLPKELFEQTVRTQKRFLVHLVDGGQRLVLAGPDVAGTTHDPLMVIEHSEKVSGEILDQPRVVENNYYNIQNAQLHFGTGDNVGGNKVYKENSSGLKDIPLWLKYLVALLTIVGVLWGVYTYFKAKNSSINQSHSGRGDNIGGDKVIK